MLAFPLELHASLEHSKSIVLAAIKPLLGSLPVNHRPDILHIRRLAVQVLQVVSVLPHINTDDRHRAIDNRVLVFGRHNAQPIAVGSLDEPAPATSLDAEQCLVESGFHLVDAAVLGIDCGAEFGSRRGFGSIRGGRAEVLPEEAVVDVAAAVEFDGLLVGDLGWNVFGLQRGNADFEGVV